MTLQLPPRFSDDDVVEITTILVAAGYASARDDHDRYEALSTEAFDRMEALDPGLFRILWKINLALVAGACRLGLKGGGTDWRIEAVDQQTGAPVNPDSDPAARPAVTAMRLMATYQNDDPETFKALLMAAMGDEEDAAQLTWALVRIFGMLAEDAADGGGA